MMFADVLCFKFEQYEIFKMHSFELEVVKRTNTLKKTHFIKKLKFSTSPHQLPVQLSTFKFENIK